MVTTKRSISNRLLSVILAAAVAFSLLLGMTSVAKADASTATYDAPTSAMSVDPNIITGTAHRAASPILGMMGLNAVSGFGMINGAAPTDLASAQKSAAVGIWGTSINDNPDPYYWNYFYNFYVDANPSLGLAKSDDALLNPSAQASPSGADGTLVEEYGNVSVSLSTRPEVVIGTASGQDESDTHGYDTQLATIRAFAKDSPYYHEGDENYSPALVPYTRATLVDMISSAKRIGAAMDDITAATGKTGRYPDAAGNSSYIAEEYESFVYGLQSYILSKIDKKKTVAIINALDKDTQTFILADASTQEATSSNRYVEYTDIVGDNMAAHAEHTGSVSTTSRNRQGQEETVTTEGKMLTTAELAQVDVIILSNYNSEGFTDASGQSVTLRELLKEQEGYNENQIIIENYPSALYGITMNSVENAMGMAYITSYMYSDDPAVDLDPVSMCAYYYQKFYHISDLKKLKEAIAINFSTVTLPEGMAGTLSDSYDAAAIEQKILEGAGYYVANPDAFVTTYIGKAGWAPTDYVLPAPSLDAAKVTLAKTSMAYTGKALKPAVKSVVVDGVTLTEGTDYTVKYASNTKVGTAKVTITGIGNYTGKATKTFKITQAANSITKITPASKSYKASALKKKAQTFKLTAKDKFSAKTTFKLASANAKAKKYIKVASSGKVTVKKGTPKGTYKIKVKVTTAKTANYKTKSVTKTITIKVK